MHVPAFLAPVSVPLQGAVSKEPAASFTQQTRFTTQPPVFRSAKSRNAHFTLPNTSSANADTPIGNANSNGVANANGAATVQCNEVFGTSKPGHVQQAVSENLKSSLPESRPLPPYQLIEAPHLSDYIADLPAYHSPLLGERARKTFTNPGEIVLADISLDKDKMLDGYPPLTAYQKAGPREQIVFGRGVRAAIVSCGGICPGINTVIREITTCLVQYGAAKIFGVPHGYRGFYNGRWRELTLDDVEEAHKTGGSMLGSSRGGFDLIKIVDAIETRNIDHVYIIGGDGTIMGCKKIYDEIKRRGLKTAVVSVPKTIDNDIEVIDRSFGFETAVDEAQRAISAAYVEAHSFPDCISVVKLMGRNSGFIACHAALASHETDCCLIPEEEFVLRGKGGVLEYIESTLDKKGSCVLVVAEGAGHERYGDGDIGRFVMDEVKAYFKEKRREISAKFLDPTYQIRAIPTTTHDNILCILMAHAAVHGAYAGFTGFSSGPVSGTNVLIPLYLLAGNQKKLDTTGSMWQRLRMSTGQPDWVIPEKDGASPEL